MRSAIVAILVATVWGLCFVLIKASLPSFAVGVGEWSPGNSHNVLSPGSGAAKPRDTCSSLWTSA